MHCNECIVTHHISWSQHFYGYIQTSRFLSTILTVRCTYKSYGALHLAFLFTIYDLNAFLQILRYAAPCPILLHLLQISWCAAPCITLLQLPNHYNPKHSTENRCKTPKFVGAAHRKICSPPKDL